MVIWFSLVEVTIGEQGRRDQSPHVETDAQPGGRDLDPHRGDVLLHQLRTRAGKEARY